MKVKIIKAAYPEYWYAEKIGEVFEVGESDGIYYVVNKPHLLIQLNDVVVEPEAIRLMEGGEVETEKVRLEDVETALSVLPHDLNCASLLRCIPSRKCDCFKSSIEEIFKQIKLTPAPPTAEQELRTKIWESVGHASVCWDENKVFDEKEANRCADSLLQFVLNWHTKHQPKEVEVTDDQILTEFARIDLDNWNNADVIHFVRWALAKAKGK